MFTKFLIVLMLLLIAVPGSGQITDYKDVETLFDGTAWASSVTETEGYSAIYDIELGYTNRERYVTRYVSSADSSQDTLQTKAIANRAYGDHFVSYALVADSVGDNPNTISAILQMGVFRGYGTVAGTATGTVDNEGILWKNLVSFTAGVSGEISLKDSTWWTDFPATHYWFKIKETGEQTNKYYINDFSFKQD